MKSRNWITYTILALILCFVLIRKFEILNYYTMQGSGMESGTNTRGYIITSCLKQASRLDLVIVKTANYDEHVKIISRLVGLPGDTLIIKNGVLYVNGINIDEKLQINYSDTLKADTIIVGKEKGFLMGDNRKKSYDSRHYGQIDLYEIIATEL